MNFLKNFLKIQNSKPINNSETIHKVNIELTRMGFNGIKYIGLELDGQNYPYVEIASIKNLLKIAPSLRIYCEFLNNRVVLKSLVKNKTELFIDDHLRIRLADEIVI